MRSKFFLILFFIFSFSIYGQDILVLNYHSKGIYESDQIIDGIISNQSDNQNIYIEYLDFDFNMTKKYKNKIKQLLLLKYKDIKIDYVINVNPFGKYKFEKVFRDNKYITITSRSSIQSFVNVFENNIEYFIDNILRIQPYLKKLYIQKISFYELIQLKKKYPHVEFEVIYLEDQIGLGLLDLLTSKDGLLLVKEMKDKTIINKIAALNNPVYAFNLTPKNYYSVVSREDFFKKGQQIIEVLNDNTFDLQDNDVRLFSSFYSFNDEHLNRYRIFYRNLSERVEFFNQNDFFILVNKTNLINLTIFVLIIFLGLSIFILIKWRSLIKELKILKNDAEKNNEIKGKFLANMTHEIRTPLNEIIGMADIVKVGLINETTSTKIKLNIIESSAKHLLHIVNEILDFSKIEAKKTIVFEEDFNIIQLLKEMSELFSNSVQEKDIQLYFYLDKKIPNKVKGDYLKIKQILINLINNSIKFTPSGEIVVKVKVLRDLSANKYRFLFSVIDTGIGISQEKKKQMFKSFTQLDDSYSRKYGGTGLGLIISKKFLLSMDSDINFKSILGKGSLFYFTLDLKVTNLNKNSFENENTYVIFEEDKTVIKHINKMLGYYNISYINFFDFEEFEDFFRDTIVEKNFKFIISESLFMKHKNYFLNIISQNEYNKIKVLTRSYKNLNFFESLKINYSFRTPLFQTDLLEFKEIKFKNQKQQQVNLNKKVLIVEDNLINAQVLTHYLKELGITSIHALNASEALRCLNNHQDFNLIFMDIQLPETNGFELTSIIREKNYNLPIIAITAHVYSGYKEKCLSYKMDDYISKPIIFEDLKDLLIKYLSNDLIDIKFLKTLYGDEVFLILVTTYLDSHRDVLETLKKAINNRDIDRIKKLSHKVVGILGDLRTEKIVKIFKKIETQNLSIEDVEPLYLEGVELIKIINYQLEGVKK